MYACSAVVLFIIKTRKCNNRFIWCFCRLHMVGGSVTIEKKEQQKLYACPLCNKTFLSKGNLSNHVKVHSVDGSSARHGSR